MQYYGALLSNLGRPSAADGPRSKGQVVQSTRGPRVEPWLVRWCLVFNGCEE